MNKLSYLTIILPIILFTGCSTDSPSSTKSFNDGYVIFNNSLPNYRIAITEILHNRGTTRASETYDDEMLVSPNHSRRLPNLIDGGEWFCGGDYVTVDFESTARDPINPGEPLFDGSVTFTVNGSQHVTIKGDDGSYEIGGD